MIYDQNNIFAQIIKGKISAEKIYEDDNILAIHDIRPVAPIHVLVFPKGEYISFKDFVQKAKPEEIADYFFKINLIAEKLGMTKDSYRIVTNIGSKAGQTIFHFHTHIISGKEMTKLIG